MYNSFMYIIDNGGIDTSSAYPYLGSVSGACISPATVTHCLVHSVGYSGTFHSG